MSSYRPASGRSHSNPAGRPIMGRQADCHVDYKHESIHPSQSRVHCQSGAMGTGQTMEPIGAFTSSTAARLARLTKRQVEYWDRTGVYSPTLAKGHGRQLYGRIYSFKDVIALRTLAMLRKHVSLQELRKVGDFLAERYDSPWNSLEFAVESGRVFFRDRDTDLWVSSRPFGQSAMPFRVAKIAADVERRFARMKERGKRQRGKLARHRYVANNQWVIAGTRIPTDVIWEFHSFGYSDERILSEYPDLTLDDVRAAIDFESSRLAS